MWVNGTCPRDPQEGEGGVTFEDGFRYFVYAESHKSKSNLMKKFREAMATYQSEQEQASVVIAQQKQRRSEALRKEFERKKIEHSTRQSVQMEMSERLTSLTTEHDAKTQELEAELQEARDQIAAMQKKLQEVAEKHTKELADARRQGAEEEQQKFANMSWLERIQKKWVLDVFQLFLVLIRLTFICFLCKHCEEKSTSTFEPASQL